MRSANPAPAPASKPPLALAGGAAPRAALAPAPAPGAAGPGGPEPGSTAASPAPGGPLRRVPGAPRPPAARAALLSGATATRLAPGLRPLVDRARLTPRLAHFGLGSFHRAHQAVYTEIGNHASHGDWGIVAVAPGSTATVAAMRAQDCFYSVTRQTARGASTRVVASIVGALHARADSAQVQRLLENPALAAVTLTITEKGYCRRPGVPTTSPLAASFPPASAPRGEALAGEALAVDPQIGNALAGQAGAGDTLAGDTLAGDRLAGEAPAPGGLALDTGDPGIAADLALAARGGQAPATAIGHLAFGLARRFRAHRIPLTLVSADNMTGNGPALRQVLLDFIAASAWPDSAAIAAWVANEVCFPETIVDRIVPAPTDAARDAAQAALGLRDQMAVACEPYRQWVIQDLFATARPPWEAAGAQFAADVRPFELAKLRLLNGAHSAIAYLGLAAGLDTVDQAMAQGWGGPLVRALAAEVAPTLPPGGPDPAAYAACLVERFANPAIGHRLTQIGADGSLKIPERWLGALRQLRAAGRPAPTIELALAAWANATRPGQDTAQRFATADPKAAELAAAWSGSRQPVDGIGHLLAAVGAADLAQDRDLLERVAARLSQAAAWPGSPAGGAVRP